MVIAIDGPAGTGKSTVAKIIAEKLGFVFLNSGSFYRGITLIAERRGISPDAHAVLISLAIGLSMNYDKSRLVINGEDVEDLLHSDAIDAQVSQISAIIPLRHIVNTHIRQLTGRNTDAAGRRAQNTGMPKNPLSIVCEGRDITTVVFPDAEYKFYLDASIDVQAERRRGQGVSDLTIDQIKDSIRKRDEMDKKKAEGALQIASDAHYIDTSHLTIDEVCAIMLGNITI
jgi:cytidylate kinase